jgi:hypothetical protein
MPRKVFVIVTGERVASKGTQATETLVPGGA